MEGNMRGGEIANAINYQNFVNAFLSMEELRAGYSEPTSSNLVNVFVELEKGQNNLKLKIRNNVYGKTYRDDLRFSANSYFAFIFIAFKPKLSLTQPTRGRMTV
jgi:hypothetical protein